MGIIYNITQVLFSFSALKEGRELPPPQKEKN